MRPGRRILSTEQENLNFPTVGLRSQSGERDGKTEARHVFKVHRHTSWRTREDGGTSTPPPIRTRETGALPAFHRTYEQKQ